MHSSTGRHFSKSASSRNLTNFFESHKHPNTPVSEFIKYSEDKNIVFLRYLGYGTIALGIIVITVTIVFLPFLFASLDGMEANIRSNGDIFKAKSNTLWSQMQSLKRNIYRRSIAANPDSLALLNLLPKGFIPFPFQKFRIKSYPPSISPYNFKELLTKEITKLFDEILLSNSTKATFNDPSPSIKEPDGAQIISSNDENEYEIAEVKKLLNEFRESDKAVMEKITEMEILESMKNAFKLAEQEEKERQGENIQLGETVNLSKNEGGGGGYGEDKKSDDNSFEKTKIDLFLQHTSQNESSFHQNNVYENSQMEQTTVSSENTTVNQTFETTSLIENNGYETLTNITNDSFQSYFLKSMEVKKQESIMPESKYREFKNHSEINSSKNIPVTEQTSNSPVAESKFPSLSVNNLNKNLFITENIIYIETPEDEQQCHGDSGEPGNDGFDGIDGLPGFDGFPGNDGEKAVYGDICNC